MSPVLVNELTCMDPCSFVCAEGTVPRWISGFTFQVSRVVEEAVTGSVADIARPGFGSA